MRLMALLLLAAHCIDALRLTGAGFSPHAHISGYRRGRNVCMDDRQPFDLTETINGRKCNLRFKPLLPSSEAVVVQYKIPFGLNVENQGGRAVCTKDGDGGEKVGDILRYTTQWTMGLPSGDGAITTAASFAGAISWQLGLFDVAKAKSWDDVVEVSASLTTLSAFA